MTRAQIKAIHSRLLHCFSFTVADHAAIEYRRLDLFRGNLDALDDAELTRLARVLGVKGAA
jgi:hypothetical protein